MPRAGAASYLLRPDSSSPCFQPFWRKSSSVVCCFVCLRKQPECGVPSLSHQSCSARRTPPTGATIGSSVAIALEAGILLGAAYALTGRLWLPIGLHLGWNFAEGSIFGMAVSGGSQKGSLITGELHGSNLLTGGVFGPEASIRSEERR